MSPKFEEKLTRLGLEWRSRVLLSTLSHWKIGGPADYVVEPSCAEDVRNAVKAAEECGIPMFVLGHGSNILFDDAGFRGVIVRLGGRFCGCAFDGTTVRAQAGVWAPALARACASRGLSGIEHVVGIPGNIGGLVFMNGGSLRQNIGDVVSKVTVLARSGDVAEKQQAQCGFSYRHSVFQDDGSIVLGAELQLTQKSPEEVRRQMLNILAERRGKFPLNLPNCGSVFSNDADLYEQYGPPGMVIDRAGLKGTRVGDAQVSQRHANFIVNLGHATSADVFALVRKIREEILHRTGFTLHCEVRYLSPGGEGGKLDAFL